MLYGLAPFDAAHDLARSFDGLLRAYGAAELNSALENFNADGK